MGPSWRHVVTISAYVGARVGICWPMLGPGWLYVSPDGLCQASELAPDSDDSDDAPGILWCSPFEGAMIFKFFPTTTMSMHDPTLHHQKHTHDCERDH